MSINNLKEATNHNHDALIDRFMESNVAINNHNDKEDKVSGLVFFVEAEDPEYQIVPCGYYLDTRYFLVVCLKYLNVLFHSKVYLDTIFKEYFEE